MTSSLMLPPAFPRGVFPPVPSSPCWPCLLLAMERQPVSQPQAGKPAWDKVRGRFGEEEVREGGSDHIVYTAQKNKLGTPEGEICCFCPASRNFIVFMRNLRVPPCTCAF